MDTSQAMAITVCVLAFLSTIACLYVSITAFKKAGINCKCSVSINQGDEYYNFTAFDKDEIEQQFNFNDETSSTTLKLEDFQKATKTEGNEMIDIKNAIHSSSNLMVDIIFWLCISDGFHSISIFLNWFPSSMPSDIAFYSPTTCIILGLIAEFLVIQSPCFHVLLASNLGYILLGGSVTKIVKYKKYNIILLGVVVPFLVAVIPCFVDDGIRKAYGTFDNLSRSDEECWVKAKQWQLIYVIFILGSLIIHYIVVIIALCKWFNVYSGLRMRYWNVVITLFRFVIVFSFVRFWPALERIVFVLDKKHQYPAVWLIWAHHIGISSLGLADGFVWWLSQRSANIDKKKKVTKTTINSSRLNAKYLNKQYAKMTMTDTKTMQTVLQTPDQIHVESETEYDESTHEETEDNKPKRTHRPIFRGRM